MTNDEKIMIAEKRSYIVSKSNQLVQKSRYELSAQQQKTISYVCSMIKPRTAMDMASKSPFILDYEFNIRHYCRVCGIDYDNGNNYREIKALLKGLRDKSYWLTQPDGSETTIGWFSRVTINKGSGKVNIKLDELMTPHLFDLQEKFTSYGLSSILVMKSQYSIRIYELLKSYAFLHSKSFEIDEFKNLLMVENIKSYKDFSLFRVKVIEIAVKEINEYSDIKVSYRPIKKGNKVVKLEFKMKNKTSDEMYSTYSTVYDGLDGSKGQLCLL